MSRYFIEDVKLGLKEDHGPFSGIVVVSVRYNDGSGSKWLHLAESCGCAEFHLSEDDINDILVNIESREDADGIYDRTYIEKLDGLKLGDYDFLSQSIEFNEDNPLVPLILYMVALVRCPMDDFDAIVEIGKGKYIDEVEIPYRFIDVL